jgi:hypothetical protein
MSEEQKPQSFMEKLDQWIEEEVFENLYAIWNESQDGDVTATAESVKKAIRTKVLESYHNGQKAAASGLPRRAVRREWPK